ncbi:MAG: winged helix-turn-helix domain-containing protein [Candidatus Eremiobacteraeota bacterium]|nr:winged helix-turn-helix domain-containing protein [Candidatus Eremiobacteraeota bacterium]
MNFREAAITILQEAGKPLHYEEIARLVIERGYIEPKGKTPQDSISTELSRDLRKQGSNSVFIKYGKGLYGLKDYGSRPVIEPEVPPESPPDETPQVHIRVHSSRVY